MASAATYMDGQTQLTVTSQTITGNQVPDGYDLDCSVHSSTAGTAAQFSGGDAAAINTEMGSIAQSASLTYDCALKKNDTPLQATSSTYITMQGTCADDTVESLSLNANEDPRTRLFKPNVGGAGALKCHRAPGSKQSLGFDLKFKTVPNLPATIAQHAQVLQDTLEATVDADGKTLAFAGQLSLDIGVPDDLLHSADFESGDCVSEGDLCKGALVVSADGVKISASTKYSALGDTDPDQDVAKTLSCSGGQQGDEQSVTKRFLCNEVVATDTGTANVALNCPYGADPSTSTPADVAACQALGEVIVHLTCANADATTEKITTELETGVSIDYTLTDDRFYQNLPTANTGAAQSATHQDAGVRVDQTFDFGDAALNDGINLRVEGPANYVHYVNSMTPTLTIPNIRGTEIYYLKADAAAACESEPITLGSFQVTFSTANIDSGSIGLKGDQVCGDGVRYEMTFAPGVTSVEIDRSRTSTDIIRVCNTNDRDAECLLRSTSVITPGDELFIPSACDGIKAGEHKFLVHFTGDHLPAMVQCGGVCKDAQLTNVTLDFSDTFKVSTNSSQNALDVGTSSQWHDSRGVHTESQISILSALNLCQADGSLSVAEDQFAADCKTNGTSFTAFDGKTTQQFVDQLGSCGFQAGDSPKAYLTQQFKVDYADANDGQPERFCHTKELSVSVGEMTGVATHSLTLQQDFQTDVAFSASLDTIRWVSCGTNGHKLEVKISHSSQAANGAGTDAIFIDNTFGASSSTYLTACYETCETYDDYFGSALDIAFVLSEGSETGSGGISVQMIGTPCDKSQDVQGGTVDLYLGSGSGASCVKDGNVNAGEAFCAYISASDFGTSHLKILSQELTSDRQSGPLVQCTGTVNDDTSSSVSCPLDTPEGSDDQAWSGAYQTDLSDEEAQFTLVVYWQQDLAEGRRMLRSEMKFGAGDSESHASIKILPAAVQIEDKVSGDAAFQLQDSNATEKSAAVDTADATFVIAICALVASVLAVLMFLSRYFTFGVRSYQPVRTTESRFKSKIDF